MWKTSLTILITLMGAQYTNADCNVCSKNNGAACITDTTFKLCFGGVAASQVFSCDNEGEVCTTLGIICADPASNSAIQADCGNTKQCGKCTDVTDGAYSCTSHNTFVMCQSGETTNVEGTCSDNEVCLTSRANQGISPCVNQCLKNLKDMCDIDSSTETTTDSSTSSSRSSSTSSSTSCSSTSSSPSTASTEPTTSSSTSATKSVEDTLCANQVQVGRYAYPNDKTCTKYVYCYPDTATGSLAGRARSCPSGRYFNSNINNCQSTKPTGCV